MSSYPRMNAYWIPNVDINKKVIVSEIQYHLGPDSTVRSYTHEGEEGFLISTPGECLTDAQIDDICIKSQEVWERQAAARTGQEDGRLLKRPLHTPVLVSKTGKSETKHRRHREERGDSGRRRHGESSSSRW